MSDAHELPFYLLFGILMAILLAGVLFMQLTKQREFEVGAQAQALADDLARTCSSVLPGQQPTLDLPSRLAGSSYELEIDENRSTFIVWITGGTGEGESYWTVANVGLLVENRGFAPGGRVYFMRLGNVVVVSASPIEAPHENILPTPSGEPSEFYYFARENQREATAVIAAYFDVSQDIDAYKWENSDSILVRAGSILLSVQGYENEENVGLVDNAWIISNIENYAGELAGAIPCPSPENAYLRGWLYSPSQALSYLRSRTWRRTSDNSTVAIPSDALVRAATVTTNVSTYPTWRVEWENYVIHYQTGPWWHAENTPGFVFQSKPELEALV
ncbi:MAG: hypothetical protein CEE41_02890 [Hadesarchaea archaeon B3_Hades]|nr:MAG: hypothetical protein CEE41_02890 [Hadesarchaea archaeon B3_Hades]